MQQDDFFSALIEISTSTFEEFSRELADEFEVSQSTILRWADGVSKPLPRLKQMVVESILNKMRQRNKKFEYLRYAP